jgi:IS30 family transposase
MEVRVAGCAEHLLQQPMDLSLGEVHRRSATQSFRQDVREGSPALRRRRPRLPKLAADLEPLAWIKDLLAQRWSPSLISRALRREVPARPDWHLAPETGYLELYRPNSLLLRRPAPSHCAPGVITAHPHPLHPATAALQ